MRDDLHTKASLPKSGRKLFRLVLNAADRCHPDRLVNAAAAALQEELDACASPSVLATLASSAQPQLIGPLGLLCQAGSPFEERLIALMANGDDKLVAVRRACQGFAESHIREMRARIVADGTIHDSYKVIRAAQDAFNAACDKIVDVVSDGRREKYQTSTVTADDVLVLKL